MTRPVITTLRRSWWIITLFALLGLGVAQVMVAASPTLYSSTSTLYVSATTRPGDSGTSAYEGNLLSQDRVKSYKALLASGMIAGEVADRVGGGATAPQLQADTEVANQPETVLLTVTVTDPSPERAAQIANAYGEVFGDSVRALERPADPAAQAPVTVRTAFPATPYPIPISPRPGVALPVGLLLGLIAGVGIAVLRRRLDDRVEVSGELAALVGTRDLGSIRSTEHAAGPTARTAPDPGVADDVRRLRGALRHAVPDDRPAIVGIVGVGRAEGRTTAALDLAEALAETGDRTLLLEADLRHPVLAARSGLRDERGLVSLLAADTLPRQVVQRPHRGPDVVVAGAVADADHDRLSSSLLPAVIEELAAPYDWVVVDTPPLTTSADASILAPLTSGVVLLARHGRTRARALRRAVDELTAVGATVLGTVLVGVPAPEPWQDRVLRALSVPPAGARSMPLPPVPAPRRALGGPAPAEDEWESTATRELLLLPTTNGTPPSADGPGERTP